jgi:hypothetical protein
MKRLLLILSIAAGLTITGCGSDDSGHSHGEGADHSHEQTAQQAEEQAHSHENEEEESHSHEGSETADATHTHAGNEEEHSHSGETEYEDTHSHENEESGMQLGLDETYDDVRKGVRLTLSYNSETSSFAGTAENSTQQALPQVRVEVHLSNGTELGPTTPVDLAAGESRSIELDAVRETFDSWSAHSEMGSGEHSYGAEGDHEHQN